MEIFIGVMIFVIGLCCGSFINMLEYRTAVKYKVIRLKSYKVKDKNRSFCDFCGKQLRWYENVPVMSWLVQRGKTRCCGKHLPLLYPIVELLVGLLFVTFVETQDVASLLGVIVGLVVIVMLVFEMVFDLKYMILPDFSTGILVLLSLILIIINKNYLINYLISGLAASGFLLVLNLATRGKGMGMGDVKLALFMGLLLGPIRVVLAFYIAFIVGAVLSLGLIWRGKVSKKSLIPFGPFLTLGTVAAWWIDGGLVNKVINLIR